MENAEFNLKCLKTIDTKQGAVRAVRFNGKFAAHAFMLPNRELGRKVEVLTTIRH